MRGKPASPPRGGGLEPSEGAEVQQRLKTPDDALDEALVLTFPASDALATIQPITHVGANVTKRD